MTIRNSVVTVGTSEVTAFDPGTSGMVGAPVRVKVFPAAGNSGSVYVGATGLTADTAATGGTLVPAAGLDLVLLPGEVVKAIATAVSQKITLFVSGV